MSLCTWKLYEDEELNRPIGPLISWFIDDEDTLDTHTIWFGSSLGNKLYAAEGEIIISCGDCILYKGDTLVHPLRLDIKARGSTDLTLSINRVYEYVSLKQHGEWAIQELSKYK